MILFGGKLSLLLESHNFWVSDEMCWKEEETAKEKEEVERDHPQVVWQPPVTTGHKNSDHCNGQADSS